MTTLQMTYFERGAIRVTATSLSTRFKDEDLAPVQSVLVGRDPLWIGGIVALGLMAFANRFDDLLYWQETLALYGAGLAALLFGFGFGTLQIGPHMRERTVLFAPIWTINAVRKAIHAAKSDQQAAEISAVILGEDA